MALSPGLVESGLILTVGSELRLLSYCACLHVDRIYSILIMVKSFLCYSFNIEYDFSVSNKYEEKLLLRVSVSFLMITVYVIQC